ncbi:alcohol dehydrogenase catalytic domain-containing protein [Alicyclobacillus tolerans]|uniref:zinc-dependent alcohol dehydrogenase n=1 Tax=Alicyclobacillus tolerans TaxID=90970 RepID=UPI001F2F6BD6|nr:alcohol dehydrogenase catalytic domain-containing protein [Alicyclobacillus tolerans]MCF8567506.1 alcohol dehydrogenase catalytic domain-containing protein [Alicyclobacillus tolerans]
MKAVLIEKPNEVVITDVELAPLGNNEVRIQVKVAGICGSDIHAYKGLHPFRKPPVLIGHEISGEVVEIGPSVTRVKVGDRVTVEPQVGCGKCEYCLQGHVNYCENRKAPGIGKWYGTMAEYFVAPEEIVFTLPPDMDYKLGALSEPLAVGVHAVRRAGIKVGDRVAVLGTGPIGLLALAVAREAGATTILATDVFDYCLESATSLGASHTLNISGKENWVEEAKEMVGGPFDQVLIAVGVPGIVNQAVSLVKRGGRIVTIAMFHGEQSLDIMQLQGQEKELIGCFCYTREDTLAAVELLSTGRIRSEAVVTHVLPFTQAADGFRIVDKKEQNSLKVLLTF